VFALRCLLVVSMLVALAGFPAPEAAGGESVRAPAWAGRFYPRDREALEGLIASLMQKAARTFPVIDRRLALRALIMPHAGYAYSGLTAAHAALAIERNRFRRVVLIGPDHRVGFQYAAVTLASRWQTPLGEVPIGDLRSLVQQRPEWFTSVPAADDNEHCLEVILPFLQVRLSQFELIPLVLGPCDTEGMARAIETLLQAPRTLLVVSTDLSHYLDYGAAVHRDRETLDRILSLDPQWHRDQHNRSCGHYPVGVLLALARRHKWQPMLLHCSNSGDTAGDKDAVVGYGAVAFYGDETMPSPNNSAPSLTPEQGAALVTLARRTLTERFGQLLSPDACKDLDARLADQALQTKSGTFVTLKSDNQLRGCIGSLAASASIVDGIRENALNAAFHDPRFPPLKKKELPGVHIEVSVLTEPVPLEYTDAEDLLAKLEPGVDGVIIRKGYASATFLPQVWEQLPQPESFLSHLCMKAGLPAGQWREGGLTVLVYRVQYFEEE